LEIREIFGYTSFEHLAHIVKHWVNDSKNKQGFKKLFVFFAILHIYGINIHYEQKDIQEMHHAANQMDVFSIFIPLERDHLVEVS
jgi:hypothetical protein